MTHETVPSGYESFKGALRWACALVLGYVCCRLSRRLTPMPLASFAEVLEYALKRRDDMPAISSLLLKRERRDENWLLTQAFTDEQDQLIRKGGRPVGRTLLAKELDEELVEHFGSEESFVLALP